MGQQIQGTSPQPAKTLDGTRYGTEAESTAAGRGRTRKCLRGAALQNAVRKRADGVPTYTVAETAALLSISQEYLYRLIQAGGFPAVRMRIGGNQGRYIVPAKVVEQLLDDAAESTNSLDLGEWAERSDVAAGGAL